jgi:hypothetical protein
MGYTGRVVLAKGDGWGGEAHELSRDEFAGGWVAVAFDDDPRLPLRALAERTAAPVLSAFVMDSDCADVTAASPAGRSWHAYLHEETALSYGAPELDDSAEEVADAAAAWATEAGLNPDRKAIATALESHDTFVENTLAALLAALGLVPRHAMS